MSYAEIFETIMLLCFGSAWPLSIYKSYTARSNRGKSPYFLFVILAGYVSGIVFQFLAGADAYFPLFVFFLNAALVSTDISLYFRNGAIEKRTSFSPPVADGKAAEDAA